MSAEAEGAPEEIMGRTARPMPTLKSESATPSSPANGAPTQGVAPAGSARPNGRSANARGRSLLIDVVKGLAIALVALGHTNQGEMNRGWWGASHAGRLMDAFIYSFHMPAFFLVSGVFLCASAEKRGTWGFVAQKLRTILFPYAFWWMILPFAPLLFGRYMIIKAPDAHLLFVDLVTGNGAWFLPALFVSVTLAMLLRRVPLGLLFVATAVLAFYWRALYIDAIDRGITDLPFVVAGMWLGRRLELLDRVPLWLSAALAALLGTGLFAFTSRVTDGGELHSAAMPMGLAGAAMLLLLGRALGTGRVARAVAWVGIGSVAVFLFSPFPQGGVRELLVWLHVTQPAVQLLVPTFVAIVIPAWIYQHRERLHIGWTLALPEPRRAPETRSDPRTGVA